MDIGSSIGILVVLAALAFGIILTVFWILMLINAAKREKWGWFVVMLIFGVIVSFLYRIVDYEQVGVRR